MKRLNPFADLSYYSSRHILVEWQSLLLANKVEQISGGHKLCHDIEEVIVLESLDELEDICAVVASDHLHDF